MHINYCNFPRTVVKLPLVKCSRTDKRLRLMLGLLINICYWREICICALWLCFIHTYNRSQFIINLYNDNITGQNYVNASKQERATSEIRSKKLYRWTAVRLYTRRAYLCELLTQSISTASIAKRDEIVWAEFLISLKMVKNVKL